MDNLIRLTERNEEGLLADRVQLYGMEQFPLDHLTVLEGDLAGLFAPGSRKIAAVYADDDYCSAELDSHWARLGDTVTIRYVEEYEYYNPDTGEVYGPWENVPEGANWVDRAVKYRDVEYEVAALVTVPQWLDREKNALKGTVTRLPAREDIDVPVEEHLIVELYSK